MESKKSPFFSVAIPVYNGEKYITACISSILNQSFKDIEVLVINDGSTDATEAIVTKISENDPRVRIISLENGGVFRARAYGAAEACGTYLTYCDDDDVYADKRAFEKLYKEVKSEAFQLVQCGYYKKFNHLKFKDNPVRARTEISAEEFYEREYPYLLTSRNIDSRLMLNTVTKLYHKSLYKKIPCPEGLERLYMGDDLVINLHLLEGCTSALYLPDSYYVSYRLNGSTGNYRKNEMHNLDRIKHYQKIFLDRWNGKAKEKVESLHHFETADWLYLHIVRSVKEIGEEETRGLVSEVLALPAFVRAREYFKNKETDSLPVRLILSNDPDEYVRAAKADRGASPKARIYNFIKEKIVFKI